MKISLRRYADIFLKYLRPQRKKAALLFALLLSGIGLQLLNPQILRHFINTVQTGAGDGTELVFTALLFLAAALGTQVLSTLATYVGADVGWRATNMLRQDMAEHALRLDMGYHNERTPGEMIERIDGDITALSNFFSQFVVKVLGSALLLVGALVMLFREDTIVGAALTAFTICAALILNSLRDYAVQASAQERQASADLYGFLEERLAGIDDIRANGGGSYTMRRFHRVMGEVAKTGKNAWLKRSIMWVAVMGLFAIGDTIALGLGIWLFQGGTILIGTVYLIFQYTDLLRTPIENITHQMQDLQKAGAAVGRVEQMMRETTSMKDGHLPLHHNGAMEVRFHNVTFAYGQRPVLKEVAFTLKPGTVVGLLGRTGSGKSTMTRLLFRLYDPTSGAVLIDGNDLRDIRFSSLRRGIGMVTQDVQLFHATLRQNLTWFDDSIPDSKIWEVVDLLGLHDWFSRFAEGLDTVLAAGGGGLSAGEAQLLSFARLFLRDPGLVILDEPSSKLDRATEQLLEGAMARLTENRTAIIIAHRLSTVARADEIMILEDGRLREHGQRALLETDTTSRYYALLQTGLEKELA